MTVAELSDRMGASELDNWRRFYNQDPFGSERDNWHMGVLASLFHNSRRRKNSDHKVKPGDFFYGAVIDNKDKSEETARTLASLDAMATKKVD